ncbi:M14 family zinc carboxypeptidase [Nocardioides sp. LHG3406-4]|uniref:M14 family zinc carboxypeptidase n=1 Tax=Nocardioides sp. LHG3406-4 TaxID=2804575 RepID=UPI003CEEF153
MRLHRVTTSLLTAAAVTISGVGLFQAGSAAPPGQVAPTSSEPRVDVPTPAEFFGFAMGDEGKLAAFAPIKDYLQQVAEASPEIEYEVVGETTEGEDFPILRISSAENLARLDEILDINARLSDPAKMTAEAEQAGMERDDYARQLAATSKPVYYVEAGIHSTEVSSTQALMDVVYRMATEDSDVTRRWLDNMVVLMVPSQNPDGHNRVINYFNETAGTGYARVFPDLYQKYVGHDNNRDWFMMTQVESKIRVALEQKYRPVAQHYMHQAGTDSPRIWSPPWDEPMSPVLDPLTVASANSIGQEANSDLVAAGKKGAKTDDAYGIMWNADVMGYSTFQGTSTWLTEIASARDLAYTVTSDKILEPATATLRSPLPYDSKTWTFKQMVQYGEVAAYSGMDTVASDPMEWLYNNLYRSNANSETYDAGPAAYVVSAQQRDPYAVMDMLSIFDRGNAEILKADRAFTVAGTRYPKGSWILRTDQPLGRWVDQLLRVDAYPDSARKCATCPLILPYSETTDNLGLLMGVDVDAVDEAIDVATTVVEEVGPVATPAPPNPGASGAYVLSPTSYGLGKVITALEHLGVPMFRAEGRTPVVGRTLPPGALMVAATPAARKALTTISAETGLPVYAALKLPKTRAIELAATTKVGLVRGANNMPGGWMMWMLEQWGVDYEVVEADDYADLAQFDTVVLAPGVSTRTLTEGLDPSRYPEEFHWARGVPDAPARLRAFVEGGGNLVALGSASMTAKDALALPVENVASTDRSVLNVPGALLKQSFRTAVPAAWGMPASWPVWFNNDPAFRLTGPGEVAASYPAGDDLLASGYALGSGTLAGAANVATFDVGEGQATIAGGHITFRTWPRAAWTVVTNAIYNGAGTPVSAAELATRLGEAG